MRSADAYDQAVVAAARAYRDADEALRRHTQERESWRGALNNTAPGRFDRTWRAERDRLVAEVARTRIDLHRTALE